MFRLVKSLKNTCLTAVTVGLLGVWLGGDAVNTFAASQVVSQMTSQVTSQNAQNNPSTAFGDDKALRLKVVISGVDDEQYENTKAHLPVYRPFCNAPKDDVEHYEDSLKSKMKSAMNAIGYYDALVEIRTTRPNDCWRVQAVITPDIPVRVKNQDIRVHIDEGDMPPLLQKVLDKRPYKTNAPLNHKLYTDYKTALSEAAQASGYLDHSFITKQILVNKARYQADIVLYLRTGKRFRFGSIEVEQDKTILENKYLERFILLKQGQFYTTENLIRQQQLLQNSGYYSVVRVEADYERAEHRDIPVKIKLVSNKRNNYKAKLGYGTDTGVRLQGEMKRRWLGKKGRQFYFDVGLSQRINEVETRLTIPKKNPEDNNAYYTIGWKRDENDDIVSNSFNIGVVSNTKYDNGWQRTLSLKYLNDSTDVISGETGYSHLTLFGVKYAKTHSDGSLFPQNGWKISVEGQGAADAVLSDSNVFQFQVHGKYIRPIGAGRMIARGSLGTVLGENIEDLPKDLRFFAGGINSVRGYDYQSLGNTNDDGAVVGGRNLVAGSLEYEYPLDNKWGVAAFVDAGNAFDDWGDMDLSVGYGVGARWKSPVGPLRFDVAVPHDDPSNIHLHLSIGSDL